MGWDCESGSGKIDGSWGVGKQMDMRVGMGWSLRGSCEGWEKLLGSCWGWRGAMSQNGADEVDSMRQDRIMIHAKKLR